VHEETVRSLLADAGARCTLPREFDRPTEVVRAALTQRCAFARRRVAARVAIAAAVLAVGLGVFTVPTVQDAFASLLSGSLRISVDSGTSGGSTAHAALAIRPPSESLLQEATVSVDEVLQTHPFFPALEDETWRLTAESASIEDWIVTRVDVAVPDTDTMVEVTFNSGTVALEDLLAFAERFVSR